MYDREYTRALGTRLRKYREGAGLTQQHVAEKIGWFPQMVSQMEHGKRKVYAEEILSICGALSITVDQFYGKGA